MTLFNLGTVDDDNTGDPLVNAGHKLNALLGSVASRTTDVGSATATRGSSYIVPASATGAWASEDNNLTFYDGSSWQFFSPLEGTEVFVADSNERLRWSGTEWNEVVNGGGGGGGGAPWQGARISLTADETVPSATNTVVDWDQADVDEGGWWSGANPSRLTVPNGVSRVRVKANLVGSSVGNQWFASMLLNGAGFEGSGTADTDTGGTDHVNLESAVIDVTPGDYFEINVFSDTARSLLNGVSTWFEIEAVEIVGVATPGAEVLQTIVCDNTQSSYVINNVDEYDRVIIISSDLNIGAEVVELRVSIDGGTTFLNTTADYKHNFMFSNTTQTFGGGNLDRDGFQGTASFSADPQDFTMTLENMGLNAPVSYQVHSTDDADADVFVMINGRTTTSDTVNAFRIETQSGGNFVSGTIRVLGIKYAGNGANTSSSEFVVGDGAQYTTIEAAIAAVNAVGGWSFTRPAKIKILDRSITLNAGVTIPQFCSVLGDNCRVSVNYASGSAFTLSGFNRLYGLEYAGAGSNTSNTDFFIDSGDTSDNSIVECHLYNSATANMRLLRVNGATWERINVERCIVNFLGDNGYAIDINNTGAARFCDMWIENLFSDAYANFSGAANFGGNINVTGPVEDLRIKRSTIRGDNANYTGLRVSSSGAIVTLSHNNFDSQGTAAQPGFDIFAVAGSTVIDSFNTAKTASFLGTLTVRGTLSAPS